MKLDEKKNDIETTKRDSGFSLIELILVLSVVTILSLVAVMGFSSTTLHKTDQQAYSIIDVLQESRQRSLTQRRTMRVEINATDKTITIINEGNPGDPSDDTVIKTVPYVENGVFVGVRPTNAGDDPQDLSPTPEIEFKSSTHPLSSSDSVATLRFLRNGQVTDGGNDAIGTGAITMGSTIHVWSKYETDPSTNPTEGNVFRALTVLGASGSTRLWSCEDVDGACEDWTAPGVDPGVEDPTATPECHMHAAKGNKPAYEHCKKPKKKK